MKDVEVPKEPDQALLEEIKKEQKVHPNATTKKLLACFETRPMWTRTAILNQLTPEEKRMVSK